MSANDKRLPDRSRPLQSNVLVKRQSCGRAKKRLAKRLRSANVRGWRLSGEHVKKQRAKKQRSANAKRWFTTSWKLCQPSPVVKLPS